MMSYLHRYHAGCFADVHKHICLLAILEKLKQKEAAFAVCDLFAGEGIYDLESEASQKNQEYQNGVARLWEHPFEHSLIQDYLNKIRTVNSAKSWQYYPGSASLIATSLRAQDSAIFIEKHPQAFAALKQRFKRAHQVHCHQRDAMEAFKALVPFKEKRGLIFIDPSYEVKTEYASIAQCVIQHYTHFSNGIYAIWYPVLRGSYHTALTQPLLSHFKQNIWQNEWSFQPAPTQGMLKSGILILNLPYQCDTRIRNALKTINSVG